MKTVLRLSHFVAVFGTVLTACSPATDPSQPYDSGVIVVNEGNFSQNNGSLSLLSRDSAKASNGIFFRENNRPLTGIVEGYAEVGGKGLILVDNSAAGQDRVEIVDAHTFKSLATLPSTDVENPRAVLRINDEKAYITCYGVTGQYPNYFANPGYIAVVDVTQNRVSKKITLQKGAEGMALVGSEVFVTGQGDEGVIQVIDSQTDAVKSPIAVGGNAGAIVLDANTKLWTFVGKEALRIDPLTKRIETRLKVGGDSRKSPGRLTLGADGRTLFFTYSFYDPADGYALKSDVFRASIDDTTLPASVPLVRRAVSGLGFDPQRQLLYAGFTPSYAQAGYVFRYQPDGRLVDSVKVEIAPGGFFFK